MMMSFLPFAAPGVSAAEVTTTTTAQTTPATTAGTAPNVNVPTNGDETLGSVSFKTSNSKRVPIGKNTTLYVTIKDMTGAVTTVFTCSNTSIASIEKISNTSVRVYGLKAGEVVITATAGGKTAKYVLIVGDEETTTTAAAVIENPGAAPTTAPENLENVDVDLFSEYDDKLAAYSAEQKKADAGSIIVGVIGFAAIIGGLGTVISVMFSNRSPKLTLYPGSRRRFNVGGYHGKKRRRLLPDQYYRRIHKY